MRTLPEPFLAGCKASFRHVRAGRGHALHIAFASLVCFAASGDQLLLEIAGVPLIVCYVFRIRRMVRTWEWFFRQPTTLTFLAWAVWQGVSLAWSSDPGEGLAQLATLRWVWVAWLLYPVLEARRLYIVAVVVGFLIAQGTQVAQGVGQVMEIPALTFGQDPERLAGWWHPAVAGTLLVGAMGYSIPAAIMGRGVERKFAIVGVAASAVGIIATGSRGAWIAGAGLMVIGAGVWVVRARPRASTLLSAGVVAVVVLSAVVVALRGPIVSRATRAYEEVHAALVEGRYATSTGARLAMIGWSLDAAAAHPVRGIGLGGFADWSRSRASAEGMAPEWILFHGHSHNTPLYVLASGGGVGLVLFLAFWGAGARAAIRAVPSGAWGTYLAGPAWALLGLTLCWPFDVVFISSQGMANVAIVFALCPSRLPPEPP